MQRSTGRTHELQHVAIVNTSDATFSFPGFTIQSVGKIDEVAYIYGTFERGNAFMRVYFENARMIDLLAECERHTGAKNLDILAHPFDKQKLPKLLKTIIKRSA